MINLVWPSREILPAYVAALERGWSPDNVRGAEAAREQMTAIADDPDRFISSLVDPEAKGAPIVLKDGSTVPRLPGYQKWIWDGEFCGTVGVRWQPGTEALPPTCLGHIGYSVVPWKQRRGYGKAALHEILKDISEQGLRYAEVTTAPDNIASRKVIESNGGVLVEEFTKPASLGGTREVRYRIPLHQGGVGV